ncbi:hypothetical protein GCM10011416_02260 [Polaribacter pacificus]|uniref:Uncharacterized protein n=1 Tax=Polaribacter pacificus TaxID=1775173 RepID=A0A917MD18_9FLAO|nr:DUF6090 family protein [Polaribacter pacificus]GGG89403.1 hypothetical protein GCM10011416_02260 [Polaribacter pacificus]
MIKLFRKTRQNLLMENKISKYFKYAIGEIVLVVIGILIALSVSNWNENRKLQERVNNFYPKFKLQIEKNIKKVDAYLYEVDYQFKGAKRNLEILGSKNNKLSLLRLDSLILFTGTDFHLNLDMITLNEARLNENLSLIKSDTLRKSIYTFIKLNDDVIEREKIVNEDLKSELKPFINKHFNIRNLFNSIGYSGLSKSKVYKDDNKKILDSQEFENLVVTRIMYIEDISVLYSGALNTLEIINDLLEKEIKKNND